MTDTTPAPRICSTEGCDRPLWARGYCNRHYGHHRCRVSLCVNPDHLRLATRKQNGENLSGTNPRSVTGVRGVAFYRGKYRVKVMHHKKWHYVGTFYTLEAATEAARNKRNELFTHNEEDRTPSGPDEFAPETTHWTADRKTCSTCGRTGERQFSPSEGGWVCTNTRICERRVKA